MVQIDPVIRGMPIGAVSCCKSISRAMEFDARVVMESTGAYHYDGSITVTARDSHRDTAKIHIGLVLHPSYGNGT